MADLIAFPGRGLIPAIGDIVHFAGQRCAVQRHAHRWGHPTGLLLRILDGERAGMVTAADHTRITIAPSPEEQNQ